jgi:hypothetical protein
VYVKKHNWKLQIHKKFHKEILDIELNISQKYIDNLLESITNEFLTKKESVLNNLGSEIQTLTTEIENKLSV